jgi:hypothetical protein
LLFTLNNHNLLKLYKWDRWNLKIITIKHKKNTEWISRLWDSGCIPLKDGKIEYCNLLQCSLLQSDLPSVYQEVVRSSFCKSLLITMCWCSQDMLKVLYLLSQKSLCQIWVSLSFKSWIQVVYIAPLQQLVWASSGLEITALPTFHLTWFNVHSDLSTNSATAPYKIAILFLTDFEHINTCYMNVRPVIKRYK